MKAIILLCFAVLLLTLTACSTTELIDTADSLNPSDTPPTDLDKETANSLEEVFGGDEAIPPPPTFT